MSTGPSSCYDGYGSYDGPKKISSNKTPYGSKKKINKKVRLQRIEQRRKGAPDPVCIMMGNVVMIVHKISV